MSCAICFEPLPENPADQFILPCKHAFHAVCCANHFWKNRVNCPLCRRPPAWDEGNVEGDVHVPSAEPNAAELRRLLSKANRESKKDKPLARRVATLKRNATEASALRAELKTLQDKLRPLEDNVEDEIDAFADKKMRLFDKRHGRLVEQVKATRIKYQRKASRVRALKKALARQMNHLETDE